MGGRLCSVGRPDEGDTELQIAGTAQPRPKDQRASCLCLQGLSSPHLTGALAWHMPVRPHLFYKVTESLQKERNREGESVSLLFPVPLSLRQERRLGQCWGSVDCRPLISPAPSPVRLFRVSVSVAWRVPFTMEACFFFWSRSLRASLGFCSLGLCAHRGGRHLVLCPLDTDSGRTKLCCLVPGRATTIGALIYVLANAMANDLGWLTP